MAKIFLVEDDQTIATTLQRRLAEENFQVTLSQTIADFKAQAITDADVFILDVGLPDGSGFDLVTWIRQSSKAPIIFTTALNSAENRLKGYELGAHEFIPKPFLFQELLLRLRHVLHEAPVRNVIKLPKGALDLDKMCFEGSDGGVSFVAAKDFRVLQLLIQEYPKPVSRDQMLDLIWGEDKFPSQRTIDNCIVRLRQTIGDEDGDIIRSIRGVGYQWVPDGKNTP